MFSSEFCETFKNTYFYRTPPVAATVLLSGSNSRLKFKQLQLQTFVLTKTSFVFVFRRRLQDVFKTSWSRRIYSPDSYFFRRRLQDVFKTLDQDQYIRLGHTSSRRYQDVLRKRLQDILKTSSRHFQDIFKTSRHLQDILLRRFQDVFKTSSRRLAKMSSRPVQDVSLS